ncbi:hypothetical protein ACWFMI_04225 [Nocardiopsis terrae]
MGHGPGVVQGFTGGGVRLSQENQDAHVAPPLGELPRLLAGAREQLLGLLALVGRREGPEVAALLDRTADITGPPDRTA